MFKEFEAENNDGPKAQNIIETASVAITRAIGNSELIQTISDALQLRCDPEALEAQLDVIASNLKQDCLDAETALIELSQIGRHYETSARHRRRH